jgi:hypothetical protein
MIDPHALLSAHPWRRVTFATYALSLSFFEAVVLDALTRGRTREAIILADVDGIGAALGEQGARRAGRDYQLEPIAIDNGVFHPKITVLADDDCHLLVGSGNLTFGGWGGNLEALEHLHPSFAANAFDDAAALFDGIAADPRFRHEAGKACVSVAEELRTAVRGGARSNNIRLLHNLDRPIGTKLAEIADSLGGATRLTVASPFWSGAALDQLCKLLGLDHAYVHAHAHGVVEGKLGSNWPSRTKCAVRPVQAAPLSDADAKRLLHAKMFEVVCKRGRVVLSGSANATVSALTSTRNVETCVARIERPKQSGWALTPASAPTLRERSEESVGEEITTGILRAELFGDRIRGRVLRPEMTGPAQFYHLTSEGPILLGTLTLDKKSAFETLAPNLELLSWRGGRLVVRVVQADGLRAEGFVAVASYSEIRRRIGPMASRLFAILAGTETPTDVVAIMSWFQEHPRVLGSMSAASTHQEPKFEPRDPTVSVGDLLGGASGERDEQNSPVGESAAAWKRFMGSILAAFRTPRAPFQSTDADEPPDDEEDDRDRSKAPALADPAIEKSLAAFKKLFEVLLAPQNEAACAGGAFDLTLYVCERLQPDFASVKSWLQSLIRSLTRNVLTEERLADVVAGILILHGAEAADADRDRRTRRRLLELGVKLDLNPPDTTRLRGFSEVLCPSVDYDDMWRRLRGVKSMPEQVEAYLAAMRQGRPSEGYPDLPAAAGDAWPTMEAAITDEAARADILEVDQPLQACPIHNRSLPLVDRALLRDVGVARTRDCCSLVIACTRI